MQTAFPLTSIVSAIAGAKARQLRRDAMLLGFVCLMALMATAALFGAFALFIAQSHGLITGLLAAAGLAVLLTVIALVVRSLLRLRARRRMGAVMAGNVSAPGCFDGLERHCPQQDDGNPRRPRDRCSRRIACACRPQLKRQSPGGTICKRNMKLNEPIDPIKVRQARQGKPVLVILGISLILAFIAGWVLWGIMAGDTGSNFMESSALPVHEAMSDLSATA